MAHSTKFLNIAVTSNSMPLLASLKSVSTSFSDSSTGSVTVGSHSPGLIYAENVLPTAEGIKAVEAKVFAISTWFKHYDQSLSPIVLTNLVNSWVVNVSDALGNKGLLYVIHSYDPAGADRKHNVVGYLYQPTLVSSTTPTFFELVDTLYLPNYPHQNNGLPVTDPDAIVRVSYCDYRGSTHIAISYEWVDNTDGKTDRVFRIFSCDNLNTGSLASPSLIAITDSNVNPNLVLSHEDIPKGIVSSNGYLILYTNTEIAWDSITSPYDFTPSLVTGAGSGSPRGLRGIITGAATTPTGFSLYSSGGVVAARFTPGSAFPFNFISLSTKYGVEDVNKVTDTYPSFAITGEGLVQITDSKTEPVAPEIADFINAGYYETYLNGEVLSTTTPSPLDSKITYIGKRFICISYKTFDSDTYDYFLVYDTQLKAFGKVKISHINVFPLELDILGEFLSAQDLLDPYSVANYTISMTAPLTYKQLEPISYTMMRKPGAFGAANSAAVIGILTDTGSLTVIDPSLNPSSTTAVAVFGNMALKEGVVSILDHVIVENVPASSQLTTYVSTSYGGTDFNPPIALTSSVINGSYRKYNTRTTGLTHRIAVEGSFNLTRLNVALRNGGYR